MTIFTPLGRIISVEDKLMLQMVISEIKMLGHAVYVNLRWLDPNYTDAIKIMKDSIVKKGSKENHAATFIEPFTDFNLNYADNRNKFDKNHENLFLFLNEEFLALDEEQKKSIQKCMHASMVESAEIN